MPALPLPEWTARIAEWDSARGYGTLEYGNVPVVVHRSDCAKHYRPKVGDMIRFTLGNDDRGRSCAKNVMPTKVGLITTLTSPVVLACLLALPALAAYRSRFDGRWIALYAVLLSVITYRAYASDKKRARTRNWRIPEARLHLLELLGGWPGAWLAQKRLRHKSSKVRYQLIFWMIVVCYQFAAFDSLQVWQFSRGLWGRMDRIAKEHGLLPPKETKEAEAAKEPDQPPQTRGIRNGVWYQ